MSLPTISDHNDIVLSPFATLVITTHGNKTPLQSSGCFFFLQRLSLLNTGTDTDGGESFFFRHFNAYNASSTETQSTILGDNCNKVLFMCEATNLPYFTYAKLCSSPKTHSLFLVKALVDSASPIPLPAACLEITSNLTKFQVFLYRKIRSCSLARNCYTIREDHSFWPRGSVQECHYREGRRGGRGIVFLFDFGGHTRFSPEVTKRGSKRGTSL